jgi:hypothetical protein
LLELQAHCLAYYAKRDEQLNILKTILNRHQLPMHWKYIFILANQEDSELFYSENIVRGLMFNHPNIFEMVTEGAFRIKNKSRKSR